MIRARWRFTAVTGCVLTFALAAGRSLGAQGTITGKITSDGSIPIADARVIVLGGQASATTGEDGKYTLKGVAAGTIEIQALKVGYRALKKTGDVSQVARA